MRTQFLKQMATKLFIPGPTEVAPEVLAAMSGPMMGHRSKAASALQRRISNNLRRILLTEQEICFPLPPVRA